MFICFYLNIFLLNLIPVYKLKTYILYKKKSLYKIKIKLNSSTHFLSVYGQ